MWEGTSKGKTSAHRALRGASSSEPQPYMPTSNKGAEMRTADALPSRGSQSHRGDEQINASTGNREAWAAAGLDS